MIIIYKEHIIERCALNSSGMKYNTLSKIGILRADTLKGIKNLISLTVNSK